ncbi:hypothetical protein M9H77_09615 [Catharanthus roseus]|uniref:Uncharacterized protein n=1 Tax=Catharanthus roseus TaxID=4058 RepID=A0ACC0C151_CATRO|nr:hypothetical protein M9H77_09615 [Catharanthus roseus]
MPGRFGLTTRAVRWRPAEDPPAFSFYYCCFIFYARERERDRGRRLLVIPSWLRPVSEGYNFRSSFSLPSMHRRDSAAAQHPFSCLVTLHSSASASDDNLSDLRSFSDLANEVLSGLPPGFCLLLFGLPLVLFLFLFLFPVFQKQKPKPGLSPRDFNSTPVLETSNPILDGSDEEEEHPRAQTQALRDYQLDHPRYGYSYILPYAFAVASYVEEKEPLCFFEVLKSPNRILWLRALEEEMFSLNRNKT